MLAFLRLFRILRSTRSPVSPRLRALVSLRVAQLDDCAFCADLNTAMLAGAGADADTIASVQRHDASRLSTDENLALEYAEAVTATPPRVDDALFARMRAAFTPEAIVELTAVIAFQNMSARFNAALGAEPQAMSIAKGAR